MGVHHGTSSAADGPVVSVRLSLTRVEARRRQRARLPHLGPVEVVALIDTGAQVTCISADAARRLGVAPTVLGMVNAPAATGLSASLEYEIDIRVLNPNRSRATELVVVEQTVYEIDLQGTDYDMILGRDVLAQCVFTYDGLTDSFTLSY